MSLVSAITTLVQSIGTDIKALYSKINYSNNVPLSVGYPAVNYAVFNVPNILCTELSVIEIVWNEDVENSTELDNINFTTISKVGSFDIIMTHNDNQFFGGVFNIKYKIN